MRSRILAFAVLLPWPCVVLNAQTSDTTSARDLAPGVAYRQFRDVRGPWMMNVLRVDLRRRDIELRHARALDQLKGREKTTDIVKRATAAGTRVIAAVNADFFWLTTGENENNQVIGGEWWKGVKVTDSPYDTYDNAHVQFAIDASGKPLIERFVFEGRAWARGTATPIITLNFHSPTNPEGVTLYTSRYGGTTPRDTARQTVEAAMVAAGRRGDTLLFVRHGAVSSASGSAIPSNGAVLAAYGAGVRLNEVKAMSDGDTVRVLLSASPRVSRSAPSMIIGGWPRILRDGIDVTADAATLEGTLSRNAEMRHPRTAVGFSRDSSTLFILTVDGRSEKSVGVTLVELAALMRRLGAWNAMNFDGGGSTTMVVDGAIVNATSDPTGERPIGNALLVVKTP